MRSVAMVSCWFGSTCGSSFYCVFVIPHGLYYSQAHLSLQHGWLMLLESLLAVGRVKCRCVRWLKVLLGLMVRGIDLAFLCSFKAFSSIFQFFKRPKSSKTEPFLTHSFYNVIVKC